MSQYVKSHFLDSGAFSQWTLAQKYHKEHGGNKWDFFHTDDFYKYMDDYAAFVKKYKIAIDLYANVDVIGNAKLTWRNQKYLEKKHNLKPVPVVHFPTNIKWLKRYMNAGYKMIGLGGLAKNIHGTGTVPWLDDCFTVICNTPEYLPKIKIHGFGVSSVRLWLRYPWWSVDSTSIHKKAAYGWILVPFYRKGRFVFDRPPMHVSVSQESPLVIDRGKHFFTLTLKEKDIISTWLKFINIPIGDKNKKGVINDGSMRKIALYYYYKYAAEAIPPWPWPFIHSKRTLI